MNNKKRLELLIKWGSDNITGIPEKDMFHKPNPSKWSKKEILGHLIDSAEVNLHRFTEILEIPASSSYQVKPYNQDAMVEQNNYQITDTMELLLRWRHLNERILKKIKLILESDLNHSVFLISSEVVRPNFLVSDYINHTEHHLKQIISV